MCKVKMVCCPKCGGSPDMDEDGRFFDCYYCANEGAVPESWVIEEARDVAWAQFVASEREIKRCIDWGIPYGSKYYIDEYEGVVVIPDRNSPAPPAPKVEWEDIPF